MLTDGFGIGRAIWNLTYSIFIFGPLCIVNGLGDAITFLSGPKIINLVFDTNSKYFKVPPQFIIFLAISIALVAIFGACSILQALIKQNVKSELVGLFNRIIMFVILMVFIPLFFWLINFTITSIMALLMPQLIDGRSLADLVGKLGFIDGKKHDDWHYDIGYPDWNHYNLFLGAFGSIFCLLIFFLMGISLIKRNFDLFLLYIISPVVLASIASGAKWQKIHLWKDLVIGRFISSLGIILTLTLFINLQPIMLNVATNLSSDWVGQATFQLLFLAGGAVAVLDAQLLFSTLIGNTVGVHDGLNMLIANKNVNKGLKTGTLGAMGVGTNLMAGKKGLLFRSGTKGGIREGIKSSGIAKAVGFATKTTVGKVLSGTGFINGTNSSIAKSPVLNGAIQKPVKNLGKIIKNKVKDKALEKNKKIKGK